MADEQVITSDALETLNESQRKAWEASGEWPMTGPDPAAAEPETPAKADTTPAPAEVAEPADDDADVNVPDPDASDAGRKLRANRLDERINTIRNKISVFEESIRLLGGVPPRLDVREYKTPQDRINHLTRQKNELDDQLTRMLKDGRAARTEAPKPAETPKPTPQPAAPVGEPLFQSYVDKIGMDPNVPDWSAAQQQFSRDYGKWIRAGLEQEQRQAQQQREFERVSKECSEREASFATEHPDYRQVITPFTSDPRIESPTGAALVDFLKRSEVGPRLIYAKTAETQRLLSLSVPHALYELGKLEASLTAGGPPTSASTPAKPVVSVSTAPPPPPQISARPGTPLDDADAALGRGDFAAYQRAMNAREVAARK